MVVGSRREKVLKSQGPQVGSGYLNVELDSKEGPSCCSLWLTEGGKSPLIALVL